MKKLFPAAILACSCFFSAAQNVGIGTTTPATKLEVAGTTKTTGFQMVTNASPGKFLQSDSAGVAVWVTPNAVFPSNAGQVITALVTTSNSNVFTVPPGVYSLNIEAVGAGGGGGGSGNISNFTAASPTSIAGGGGGGEYGAAVVSVKPGDVIGVVTGNGGSGGSGGFIFSAGSDGTDGGSTSVSLNGITIFSVNGGAKGGGSAYVSCTFSSCVSSTGTPGNGGSGGTAPLSIPGGAGSGATGGSGIKVTTGTGVNGGNGGNGSGVSGLPGNSGMVAISYIQSSLSALAVPLIPNAVLFAGPGGIISSNYRLAWDNVNNRLGIGTVTPVSALDVSGTVNATNMTSGTMSANSVNATNMTSGTISASSVNATNITATGAAVTNLTATNFNLATGAGTGKILKSNASGDASWYGHTIGESYGGGIIFYLYDNGQHGLIVSTSDQSSGIRWHAGTYFDCRAKAQGIGSGLKNTAIIIGKQAAGDGNPYAASVCNEYGGSNFGDWYLPGLYELTQLYNQRAVAGISSGVYWCSTEFSQGNAYIIDFSNGSSTSADKVSLQRVRAIRAF